MVEATGSDDQQEGMIRQHEVADEEGAPLTFIEVRSCS